MTKHDHSRASRRNVSQYSAVILMAIEGILEPGFDARSSQTDAVKPLVLWESPQLLSIVRVTVVLISAILVKMLRPPTQRGSSKHGLSFLVMCPMQAQQEHAILRRHFVFQAGVNPVADVRFSQTWQADEVGYLIEQCGRPDG